MAPTGNTRRYTTVVGNLAREVGLYEKQSSFFVQAKTAQSIIQGNVFFNGPRAGINVNDGFGGGDDIFHVPGEPSMRMAWREIHHNFFIDNYSPQEDVDNDDGSAYYHTHANFLVYGGQGMKNDFGGHDNHLFNIIYGYVGRGFGVCAQLDGHEDQYYGNKLVTTGTDVGSGTCKGAGMTVVHDNQYVADVHKDVGGYVLAGHKLCTSAAAHDLALTLTPRRPARTRRYFTSTGDITECGTGLGRPQATTRAPPLPPSPVTRTSSDGQRLFWASKPRRAAALCRSSGDGTFVGAAVDHRAGDKEAWTLAAGKKV